MNCGKRRTASGREQVDNTNRLYRGAVSDFSLFENKRTGGADADALPAFQAGLAEGLIGKGSDRSPEAAVGKAKNTYSQALVAYPYTPLAENAFIRVVSE